MLRRVHWLVSYALRPQDRLSKAMDYYPLKKMAVILNEAAAE
jgi:hypothetical protein